MDPASQAAAAAAGYPGVGLPANLLGGIAAPPGLLVDPATGIGLMLPAGLQQQLQQQHQNPGLGAAALDAAAAGGGGKAASAAAAAEGPSADVAMPPSAAADPADPEAVAAALAGRMAAAGAVVIFEKALTASDVSGGGRVVVPKSIAEQYFPRLEAPSGVTISATDLDGRTYTFKWRFWVNNSSRMYLLEGAGELHRNYGLDTGDVMVFAQKPDGSLVVAGRVANKSDMVRKPPAKRSAAAANVAGGGGGGQGAGGAAGQARGGGRDGRTGRVSGGSGAAVAGGQRPGGPGGAAGAAGGTAVTAAALKKRRAAAAAAAAGAGDPFFRCRGLPDTWSLSVLDLEAPSDGVFRALVVQPPSPTGAGARAQPQQPQVGVALARSNRWTATLDVAGELYQAFFDTREDAMEALAAAGAPVA